jgi:uncharacterized protein DUF4261
MPHKGFFTQGAMVLTQRPLAADAVDDALRPFRVVKRSPAEGEKNWTGGYPSWVIAWRPEVNGNVTVDVVDAPWPDNMGDPKSPGGQSLFAAWSMGFMGPMTWPGNLLRATEFAEAFGDKAAAEGAKRHQAFVRVRSTYVLGSEDEARTMPQDYQARPELDFVTSVAAALAAAPGALCYFNPGGETLLTAAELARTMEECRGSKLPPLPVWSMGRLSRIDDAPPWMFADVVGMEQLDAQDHEACFRSDTHDPAEVMSFLRNTTNYVLENGPVIKDGHTTDGPGGVWRAMELEEGLLPAPRPVLRWFPADGPEPPPALSQPVKGRPLHSGAQGLFGRLKTLFNR